MARIFTLLILKSFLVLLLFLLILLLFSCGYLIMDTFTNDEYADILMAYGKATGVGRTAQIMYQERFPNRRSPTRNTFQNTYRRLRETGNLNINEVNNKKPDPTIRAEIEGYQSNTTSHVQYKLYHIFKYGRLTKNLACMSYLYFICGMGYYGVSQYISKMSGDIHLNIVVSALLVMPGTIASAFLLPRVGRKKLLSTTCFVSGGFMIIAVIIPSSFPNWLKVIFACISNCFFFMSFIVVFLFGVELFPTQIRNSALGFLSLLSRAGMMVAPPINSLSQIVSGILFGVMALVGGALTICLPETKNRELPSTLEEANAQT